MKLLDKIVFIVSIVTLSGLLGAYTARYVNPDFFVIPSLLGLAYPYLLVANILLLFYWTARWKKTGIVTLLILCAGIPFFTSYYGISRSDASSVSSDISVLSYNVRFFDKFGWSKSKQTYHKLLDYLNRFKGDFSCLQEFPANNNTFPPQEIVKSLSTYPYRSLHKDMAIFSRLPILHTGQITFDKNQTGSAHYCDVLKGKDTIRIYNIHLESYRLGNKERKFVKEITNGATHDFSQGVKNILSHIVRANKARARQALLLKGHIAQSPYKVILCGDFNDTPLSYTYNTIRSQLTDSFLQKGHGLGNTYIGEFPSFRIDYIFHSPGFITTDYTRHSISLSDHYPISCKLKIHP